MARLGRLIQGQDVAFDTHQSGDRQEVRWQGLHLEKRLHRGGKIRFPFFGEPEPTASERVSDRDYRRVINEVRKTLDKNAELREQLAETVVSELTRFRNGTITIEDAQRAARNLAHMFELGEEFIASAVVHANARISRFATLHPGKRPGTVVEIVQSAEQIAIQRPRDSWPQWRRNAL